MKLNTVHKIRKTLLIVIVAFVVFLSVLFHFSYLNWSEINENLADLVMMLLVVAIVVALFLPEIFVFYKDISGRDFKSNGDV